MLRPGERVRKDPGMVNEIVGRVEKIVLTENEVRNITRETVAELKRDLLQEIASTEARLKAEIGKTRVAV